MDEEKNSQYEKNGGNKKAIIISVISTLAVVLVIVGAYWAWQKYSQSRQDLEDLKQQVEDLKKDSGTTSEETGETKATESKTEEKTESDPESKTEDSEYVGWKTYINSEIGYQLKYPADWTLKEINQFSELLGKTVKYITITSPDKKYFLHWGLKQKTDTFAISDRSGMGAGDFQKDGQITILGKGYDITRFVYKAKTKEVFYPSAGLSSTADGKYDFTATLSYGSGSNYDSLNISDIAEKTLVEKILRSVTLK